MIGQRIDFEQIPLVIHDTFHISQTSFARGQCMRLFVAVLFRVCDSESISFPQMTKPSFGTKLDRVRQYSQESSSTSHTETINLNSSNHRFVND